MNAVVQTGWAMGLIVRVTLLLSAGWVAGVALRHASPATRHFTWTLTLAGALALAIATPFAPRVPVVVPWLASRPSTMDVPRVAATSAASPSAASARTSATPALPRVPSATERAAVPAGSRRLPGGLALLWLAGLALVLARLVVGRLALARLERRARPVADPAWLALLGDTRRTMRVRGPVRLLQSPLAGTPITWGIGRAVILLPADSDCWTLAERRDVLLHELAHVARRDPVTRFVSFLACACYWFHPGVWLVARSARAESEKACDDRVLAAGSAAPDYAALLLSVARASRGVRWSEVAAIGMARRSTIEGRLLAVLDEHATRGPVPAPIRVAGAVALAVGLTALALIAPTAPPARAARTALALATGTNAGTGTTTTTIGKGTGTSSKAAKGSGDETATTTTTGESEFERSVTAKPGERLTLDLDAGGEISVSGWDEPRVRVRARLDGADWRDESVVIGRNADGVFVRSTYEPHGSHSSSDEYEIRVPRQFDVRLTSAGGGFAASGIEGTFHGHTGGGGISLTNVKGRAELSTGGGDIQVEDANLSGSVSTGGGAVRLSRVQGGLRGTSGSGPVVYSDASGAGDAGDLGDTRIDEDGAVSHVSSSGVTHITRAGGDISLDEAPAGAEVSTGGGEVRVGRSAGRVRAATGGGDIVVGPVAGSVSATTGAGDVRVTLAKASGDQNVVVRSGTGRVRIELPADYDGTLDVETAYTRDFGRATRITTPGEWTVKRESTTEWDDREGTPRRYVRVSGTLGKGGGRVHVKTVNGDIELIRLAK
jgi:beta-lactamase regulating signal transducer with metallopeptidase domain